MLAQTTVTTSAELQSAITGIENGTITNPNIALGASITGVTTPFYIGTTGSPTINIIGNGNSIAGTSEIFFIQSGTVSISGTTLTGAAHGGNGGVSQGNGGGAAGLGGAIFVGATANVTAANVLFSNNSATGGSGSGGHNSNSFGGGGGLNGGNGGNADGDGNGGGGGNGGNGGIGTNGTGGGGGGLQSPGQNSDGNVGGTGGGPNGGAGGTTGGGDATGPNSGGGGAGQFGSNGGNGTTNGGGGGSAGNAASTSGNGGAYGGGAGNFGQAGNGGFGGGGGAGGIGGNGGFGGGGGAGFVAVGYAPGTGGVGGGTGGNDNGQFGDGGGGAGLGGAVFVQSGGTFIVGGTLNFTGNAVVGGTGANNGAAAGPDLFIMTGSTTTLAPTTGTTLNFNGIIADDSALSLPSGQSYTPGTAAGGVLSMNGAGTAILNGANIYSGGTLISSGVLEFATPNSMPAVGNVSVQSGGTIGILVGGTGFTAAGNGNGSLGGIFAGLGGQAGSTVSYAAGSSVGIDTTNGDLTYAAAISGTNVGISKIGANTLTLTGNNTYGGGTTVRSGALVIGSATALGTGDLNVAGGTLSIADGGTGMAISLGHNYNQSGGTLLINIFGDTNFDSLHLSGNNVASVGGTLQLNFANGYVPDITRSFDIISGGNPTTGQFAAINTNLPSLTAMADYASGVIILFQQPFTPLAGPAMTPNEHAVAGYIDSVSQTNHGAGFSQLVSALNGLSPSAVTLANAFDQLHTVNFAHFASSTVVNNTGFVITGFDNYLANHRGRDGTFVSSAGNLDYSGLSIGMAGADPALQGVYGHLLAWSPPPSAGLLSDTPLLSLGGVDMKDTKRMAPAYSPENAWNFFVTGNAVLAQDFSDSSVGENHIDATTGAVQLGVDYRVTPHFLIGAMFGYGHTDASIDDIGSDSSVDTYAPALYASYADSGWYANAMGSYGFDEFSQDRNVALPGFSGTAHSSPSGEQIVGDLDGGYDFHFHQWTFGPTAGIYYTHLTVDGYSETGLPGANLNVAQDETDSLRSLFGGRISYAAQADGMTFTPHLSASWQHEFLDQARGITAQFSDVGTGSFSARTSNPSRDSALVDVGLDVEVDRTWTVFADYTANAGQSNYFGQSIQAGVKIGF